MTETIKQDIWAAISEGVPPSLAPTQGRAALEKERKRKRAENAEAGGGSSTQPKITSTFAAVAPYARSEQDQHNFLLLRLFICAGVAFRIADSPFFLRWIAAASQGRERPASSASLRTTFLQKEYANVKVANAASMKEAECWTINSDGWSSQNGAAVMATCAVTGGEEKMMFVLDISDQSEMRHSGPNIAGDFFSHRCPSSLTLLFHFIFSFSG
jgi:hypothetical protein